ncbi:hypothetical protein [Vitiosangium sp. GDMCC 1.1324]|uniref:hypothetical protein n=1 Tax=Vitiosangium sp. (strain GDMCC 1.1324) TaxID=2138576 RepID=UPI00130D7F29|nr:hypothetical protein [Vitiosangium sp. GDMCC 1.1324]
MSTRLVESSKGLIHEGDCSLTGRDCFDVLGNTQQESDSTFRRVADRVPGAGNSRSVLMARIHRLL